MKVQIRLASSPRNRGKMSWGDSEGDSPEGSRFEALWNDDSSECRGPNILGSEKKVKNTMLLPTCPLQAPDSESDVPRSCYSTSTTARNHRPAQRMLYPKKQITLPIPPSLTYMWHGEPLHSSPAAVFIAGGSLYFQGRNVIFFLIHQHIREISSFPVAHQTGLQYISTAKNQLCE